MTNLLDKYTVATENHTSVEYTEKEFNTSLEEFDIQNKEFDQGMVDHQRLVTAENELALQDQVESELQEKGELNEGVQQGIDLARQATLRSIDVSTEAVDVRAILNKVKEGSKKAFEWIIEKAKAMLAWMSNKVAPMFRFLRGRLTSAIQKVQALSPDDVKQKVELDEGQRLLRTGYVIDLKTKKILFGNYTGLRSMIDAVKYDDIEMNDLYRALKQSKTVNLPTEWKGDHVKVALPGKGDTTWAQLHNGEADLRVAGTDKQVSLPSSFYSDLKAMLGQFDEIQKRFETTQATMKMITEMLGSRLRDTQSLIDSVKDDQSSIREMGNITNELRKRIAKNNSLLNKGVSIVIKSGKSLLGFLSYLLKKETEQTA
nr:MAG TPA: hypothetical protein [Caudoviricetes sp.]